MTARSSDTEMTGTSIDRATRSAVRCLVPVSDVGTLVLGTRWTLARAIRVALAARMMAPSILASSDSRWGLNSASSRKPPEQMLSTSGPSPTTISAPMLACRIRSRPSRSGRPGATAASASIMAALGRRRHSPNAYLVTCPLRPATPRASRARAWRPMVDHRPDGRWWPSATLTRVGQRGHPLDDDGGVSGAGADIGTRARPNPSRAASASRRGVRLTWRISPARPTSPHATRSAASGRPVAADARARQRARSAPGSDTRTPPTAEA